MATRSARILSLPQGPDSRLLQHRHQICCLAVFWTSHRNILCPLDIPKQMPINEVNSINYPRLGFIGLGDWVRLVDSLIPITSKQWSQQKTQQFDWGFPHDIKPQNEWKWLNLPWICHDFCDLIFCFFWFPWAPVTATAPSATLVPSPGATMDGELTGATEAASGTQAGGKIISGNPQKLQKNGKLYNYTVVNPIQKLYWYIWPSVWWSPPRPPRWWWSSQIKFHLILSGRHHFRVHLLAHLSHVKLPADGDGATFDPRNAKYCCLTMLFVRCHSKWRHLFLRCVCCSNWYIPC